METSVGITRTISGSRKLLATGQANLYREISIPHDPSVTLTGVRCISIPRLFIDNRILNGYDETIAP